MAIQNSINKRSESVIIYPLASDSQVTYSIPATQSWSIGIDNSDSNRFKLVEGAFLGTNDILSISVSGAINKPVQPAFLALHSVAQNNVTGNNASVTVNYTTEIFDNNGDYDGINLFTAPVTGKYFMYFSVLLSEITGSTSVLFSLISSNRSYTKQWNPSVIANSSGEATLFLGALVDMDALDTIRAAVQLNGIGANTADYPASITKSIFWGYLAT